jgi:hypothetical protein
VLSVCVLNERRWRLKEKNQMNWNVTRVETVKVTYSTMLTGGKHE